MGQVRVSTVREEAPLFVEVAELLRQPGTSKRVEITAEVPGLGLPLGHVDAPLELALALESLVEGLLVRGAVRGVYELECRRCLRSFDSSFDVHVTEVMAYDRQGGSEEGYAVSGDHVDLEPVVRDAVMLAMPLNPLCMPDCRGLCPSCGANRNEIDCGHRAERTDLRWEPLRRLSDQLNSPDR